MLSVDTKLLSNIFLLSHEIVRVSEPGISAPVKNIIIPV